jgi:RND family efflux transporter MFP subunit
MMASQHGRALRLVGTLAAMFVLAAASTLAVTRYDRPSSSSEHGRGSPASPATRAVVIPAKAAPAQRQLEFQGEARPFASVTLYAKVSGYLRAIAVDRGDKVQANQVLAVIQSPEIERQYRTARADMAFKRANAESAAALTQQGAISLRQVAAERASAEIAEGILDGIKTQRDFAVLRAPFSGTITARFADPGALVQNAASTQNGALPVVTVSNTDRLRVFAYVDQRHARSVRVGGDAEVTVPESGVSVVGKISRASGELDPRTRTMLFEIHLDNGQGAIVPGSFVRVRLTVQTAATVQVPIEALMFRDQKPFLAVLGADSRITLRPVTLDHLEGPHAAITSGVAVGDRVALNLGRAAKNGDLIEAISLVPPGGTGK